jgi:hypothetical protein
MSHPDRGHNQGPPEPQGRLLFAGPRRGPNGEAQELRLYLDEYQGKPYVSVRVWQRDWQGGWWPLKDKGTSIRLGEAEGIIDGLQDALDLVGDFRAPARQQERRGDRRPERRPAAQASRPNGPRLPMGGDDSLPPSGGRVGFDEFGGR